MSCTITGCKKPIKAKGWCAMHHQRWRRTGDPLGLTRNQKVTGMCRLESCVMPIFNRTHEYCAAHYRRYLRYGDPEGGITHHKVCTVPGCNKLHLAKGLCTKHYAQKNKKPV